MSHSYLKSYCSTRGFSKHPCQEEWTPLSRLPAPTVGASAAALSPVSRFSEPPEGTWACAAAHSSAWDSLESLTSSSQAHRWLLRGSWMLHPAVHGGAGWWDGLLVTSL